ncbi:MAG: DUF4340 domain-containing protein [Treponema sp.]|nr:DUF4340 domain-containing protein [Candidatus Treponema scatequi]
MTKRKIFLLSLIAVLAVTYFFQLVFASRGKITEVKVKGEITKIEIINSKGKLNLSKNEDNWLINDNLPAKTELTKTLCSTLSSVKVIDSVNKKPTEADFEKYGLTSAITVEGYSADSKKIVKLTIGKTSTTGNQTYIQLNDSKEILLVSSNLNEYFSVSEKELLDMTLYTTTASDIYKIAVTYSPSGTFTAEKAGEMADFKWNVTAADNNADTSSFNSAKFQNWVNSITELTASKWLTDFNVSDSQLDDSRYYSITIYAAEKEIKVDLYQLKADLGSEKLCICSENEYLCEITAEDVHRLVTELSNFLD